MRDAIGKNGILRLKIQILFFGCHTQACIDPVLGGNETPLQDRIYHFIERGDFCGQQIEVSFRKQDQFAVLDSVDIIAGRHLGQQAFAVADPPAFYSKPDDMLAAFVIHGICPQAPFANKRVVLPHLPFLKKILLLAQFLDDRQRTDAFGFCKA